MANNQIINNQSSVEFETVMIHRDNPIEYTEYRNPYQDAVMVFVDYLPHPDEGIPDERPR